jgi:hypothetical protein
VTLDGRIRDVLGRLEVLAEGATVELDPDKTSHQAPESKAPAGVTMRPADKAPKKHLVSLYEWYSWHFVDARVDGDTERMEALYLAAEIDYRAFRFRVAKRVALKSGEMVENDPLDGGASERANAARIVDWYEAVPAATVAMIEETTEAWVKKARLQHDRDPKTGRPRPEFYGWDDDRRRREVAALAVDRGQKAVAQVLGVDRMTVKKYWPAEDESATVAA